MTIDNKIRKAMKEAGFTQKGLAEHLGIKQPSVGSWLSGRRNPTVTTLKKIAAATGKPLNYFFDASTSLGDNTVGGNNNSGNNCGGISVAAFQLLQKDMELLKKEVELIKLKLEVNKKRK